MIGNEGHWCVGVSTERIWWHIVNLLVWSCCHSTLYCLCSYRRLFLLGSKETVTLFLNGKHLQSPGFLLASEMNSKLSFSFSWRLENDIFFLLAGAVHQKTQKYDKATIFLMKQPYSNMACVDFCLKTKWFFSSKCIHFSVSGAKCFTFQDVDFNVGLRKKSIPD